MAEFLEDPSVLTKEKLKSELLANAVALPGGEHKKEVYVQLYLKNLTVLNKRKIPPPDTFSSDEEITPVISNRSRSGKKATKKTDKIRKEELDISSLTDEDLKDQLFKCGINPGPIVASTRKLYEKRLQKLLDQPPVDTTTPESEIAVPETVTLKADGNQNGNTHSVEDQYSDKDEDEATVPVHIVTKPVRIQGKTPVTTRTSSRHRSKVQETVTDRGDILKEMFPNEPATPTGIIATCRRPIHGAAGRPVRPMDLWPEESFLQKSVYKTTRSSLMDSHKAPSSVPRPARRSLSIWLKLLVFLMLTGLFYYIFQNVTTEQIDSYRLVLEDRVVMPVLRAIGVIGQEEIGGNE
ncbi:thymopoietin b isoform X2 [Electrophorus electricus]|uniref:thymopoietin b isoform X2 n=1 Tax=Electrophorus electricus TaxID=8005 RepID=UPI0015D0C7EE|nr:thymopoietin b isoform X2 [Electrophorus electricus]